MKTLIHTALARRRRRQSVLLSVGGIAVLLVGLFFNFQTGPERITYSYMALILGSVLSWLGVSMADQWVRPPRPEEALGEAMKGAGPAYALYHWVTPADHVLLAPFGLVIFRVFNIEGPVQVKGERWRDTRSFVRKLVALGRQPVRNPARFLSSQGAALAQALVARDADLASVPIHHVGLFTHARVELKVEDPTPPALRADQLREWLRVAGKPGSLPAATRRALEAALDAVAAERLGIDKLAAARAKQEEAAKGRAAELSAKKAKEREEAKAARRARRGKGGAE